MPVWLVRRDRRLRHPPGRRLVRLAVRDLRDRQILRAFRGDAKAYLKHEPLDDGQIAAIRAYLRQWIDAPVWHGPAINDLRAGIDGLTSRQAIRQWLDEAAEAEIDPL
jgi:hypothetical protein